MKESPDLVVVAVGTTGDVMPLLHVAREAATRGIEVLAIVPEVFQGQSRGMGLTTKTIPLDPFASLETGPGRSLSGSGRNLAASALHFSRMFRELQMGVADSIWRCVPSSYGGIIHTVPGGAVRFFPLPSGSWRALALFQPLLVGAGPSPLSPFGTRIDRLPGGMASAGMRALFDWPFRARFNAWRRSVLGLSPVRDRWTWLQSYRSNGMVLNLFDDRLCRGLDDRLDVEHGTGFVYGQNTVDDSQSLPVDRALDDGRPIALVTTGSMVPSSRHRWSETLSDMLVDRGYAVLIHGTSRSRRSSGRHLTLLEGWHNYETLLDKCALVVHHGGAGTAAMALDRGAAQVVVPVMFDQFYWGYSVAALGAGVVLPRGWRTAENAVERSLDTASSRDVAETAQGWAGRLREVNGRTAAVDRLSVWYR